MENEIIKEAVDAKTILSVVVGSRLHQLNNENSDWDIRGVFMHPLYDVISPFKKLKNTSWIEGDEDNTAYELRDFCKLAVHGNPSILEVLWSNMIREDSGIAQEMRSNKIKFLDSKRIYEAHKGYAHNQYNKMNLFEPDARTPKFAVAYIRSTVQGMQLLREGDFDPVFNHPLKDFVMKVKYEWSQDLIPELSKVFAQLQVEFADVFAQNHDKFKPDINWIEDFLYWAYVERRGV